MCVVVAVVVTCLFFVVMYFVGVYTADLGKMVVATRVESIKSIKPPLSGSNPSLRTNTFPNCGIRSLQHVIQERRGEILNHKLAL